jgi:hypothetical protein
MNPSVAFARTTTCEECPWRKDVPLKRFPPTRYEALRNTVEQGFHPMFACHKSHDGQDIACAGYLIHESTRREGPQNFYVRMSIGRHFDPKALVAKGPLYKSFSAMARANGWRSRRRRRAR